MNFAIGSAWASGVTVAFAACALTVPVSGWSFASRRPALISTVWFGFTCADTGSGRMLRALPAARAATRTALDPGHELLDGLERERGP